MAKASHATQTVVHEEADTGNRPTPSEAVQLKVAILKQQAEQWAQATLAQAEQRLQAELEQRILALVDMRTQALSGSQAFAHKVRDAIAVMEGVLAQVKDEEQQARGRGAGFGATLVLAFTHTQELRRTLNLATNACCTVGIMSIWASSEAYATQGLAYGGPVVVSGLHVIQVIWGWVLVSCFSMAIALCMAELVSAFPTSGGLYYWSYMLAPVRYRRLACWMTGWINMLGQVGEVAKLCNKAWDRVATTAALELMITNFVASLVQLHTLGPGGELTHITARLHLGAQGLRGLGAEAKDTELCAPSEQPGYEMTPLQRLGVLAALLAIHAAINSIGPRTTRILLIFSGWWHVVATPAFCAMLLCVAPKHQSPAFVFTKWVPGSEASGITSPPYIFMVAGVIFTGSSSFACPPLRIFL
ncbi:hypothetical protein QJQ45_002721 [Haematococcus lacustris]|nr:hypothetical protein QJQ45_002721 [Haematococcus lacustris]